MKSILALICCSVSLSLSPFLFGFLSVWRGLRPPSHSLCTRAECIMEGSPKCSGALSCPCRIRSGMPGLPAAASKSRLNRRWPRPWRAARLPPMFCSFPCHQEAFQSHSQALLPPSLRSPGVCVKRLGEASEKEARHYAQPFGWCLVFALTNPAGERQKKPLPHMQRSVELLVEMLSSAV